MAAPILDNLSKELTRLQQFCARYEKQPFIKTPKTGKLTASWAGVEGEWTGPEGYLTFSEARKLLEDSAAVRVNIGGEWVDRPITGIGFMNMRAADPARQIVGGDIDCCRNPDTGNIGRWAYTLLHKIQPFYSEVSPSQTGVRFFAMGHLPDDVDSVTGYGDQDDLPASDREAILTAKPKAREKIAKGKPAFNGIELYVDSRHLTLTGDKLPTYCYAPEDRTNALAEALKDYMGDPAEEPPIKKKSTKKAGSFPPLNILQVIDTTGFAEHGGQLFGPHPTEGSTTGANLVVNPDKGVWAFMHDKPAGRAPGGDAWAWLACECSAVPWEKAGAGVLADPVVIAKTMQHAANRGLIPETPDIVAAFRKTKAGEEEPTTHDARDPNGWFDGQYYGTPKTEDQMLIKGMSQEEFEKFKLPEGPKFTLNLPADHFITRFIGYGTAISDAYRVYWFMSALFMLATVADKKIRFVTKMDKFYPNIWVYILGDSSLARKTTAVKKANEMLNAVLGSMYANACVPNTFSPEAFIEHMSNYPHAPWVRDEAAGVLSVMQKDYMRGFKDDLMQLFDCTPINRMLRTSQRKGEKTRFNVDDPYLNLFFASTGAALGFNLNLIDKETGFLARFVFAYPQGEKECYMPLDQGEAYHSELEEICISQLTTLASRMNALPECVNMTHSPEARAYYNEWQETREKEAARLKDGYSSQIFSRLNPTVIKLAMLFEMGSSDFAPTRPIREEYFVEACRLVDEYFMPTTRTTYDMIGSANKENQIERILLYLSRNGGKATQKEIMRDVKIKSKDFAEYLSTMLECDLVSQKDVYNEETKRNTSYIFMQDNQKVAVVAKVERVAKVGKVEEIQPENQEGINVTVDTLPTCATLPTLSTFHEDGVVGEDMDGGEKEAAPTIAPHPRKEDPGRERFKAGMKKRHCLQCGQNFSYDLGIHFQEGYICARCHREGPPAAPTTPDTQKTLADSEVPA